MPILGFTAGALCGFIVVAVFGLRIILRGQVDADLIGPAIAADTLASLRTGDITGAKRHLESQLDAGIRAASIQSASPIYGRLTPPQIATLSGVKFYRHAFPSTQEGHVETEQFLSAFPDLHIDPNPGCNAGFCRIARGERGDSLLDSKGH
jgi:hypothetical protein